jgi:hypothetical protein
MSDSLTRYVGQRLNRASPRLLVVDQLCGDGGPPADRDMPPVGSP